MGNSLSVRLIAVGLASTFWFVSFLPFAGPLLFGFVFMIDRTIALAAYGLHLAEFLYVITVGRLDSLVQSTLNLLAIFGAPPSLAFPWWVWPLAITIGFATDIFEFIVIIKVFSRITHRCGN